MSYTILPEVLGCKEFVNADEIARGLSPFQPETVAFEAGRIMLSRMKDLIRHKTDFAFETTLSTKSYVSLIQMAKKSGYQVVLLFFWLESVELAIERVRFRVSKGGHHIPDEVIKRRYTRGVTNFFNLYMNLVDDWALYNNSGNIPDLVATGIPQLAPEIVSERCWNIFKKSHE